MAPSGGLDKAAAGSNRDTPPPIWVRGMSGGSSGMGV